MYRFFRPLFFAFPPEAIHGLVAGWLRFVYCIPPLRALVRGMFGVKHPALEREFCGLKFSNPVGLAAGFDKNAKLYRALSTLGFSFIEIGTVTPKGQPGNPKPRLFRIVQDGALINRMGFNNKGVEAAVERLKRKRPDIVIGGNIGKNTATPNDDAPTDYLECFRKLYPYVDYFTVNVSCPNVANLSELQNISSLTGILTAVLTERDRQEFRKPVLVKISPDISFVHLDEILEIVRKMGVDGIVAINTTTKRSELTIDREQVERLGKGGLSGKPLTWKALETVNYIRQRTKGRLPVMGAGGIMTAEDAINMINAGATLVQVYSGFIYEGPSLVKKINRAILKHTDHKGVTS
ncbi:MAG: quinone-dependent dihydroorotate dehydrogenase [Bacteroidales bacterium]|jgi:dihydroorotate dehydrogenase|nr:quinone-dependent dihydroorotate dehydrogenase [Bacteroidales bacterium]